MMLRALDVFSLSFNSYVSLLFFDNPISKKVSLFVGNGSHLLTAGSNGRMSVFALRDHFSIAEKVSEISAFDQGMLKDAHASPDF